MEAYHFDGAVWQEIKQAILNDDREGVVRLLSASPGMLHARTSLVSCLHFAAAKGHLGIVQLLLDLGADVNLEIELGGTPLNEAATNGHLEIVKYLVGRGASLDAPNPVRNLFYSAIDEGHADVARFLLEAGADPHVVYRRESGALRNALSFARDMGQTEIADLLANAGCRLPVEGVDQPAWEPEITYSTPGADGAHEQIVARMAEFFGPVDPLALQEIVPVHDEVRVVIRAIRPTESAPYLTLFTTGMSDRPMTVPAGQEDYQYAELVLHLPAEWPAGPDAALSTEWSWPLQLLRQVAYYHHLNDSWLGGPQVIITPNDPPVPLGPNTEMTCLLLLADFIGCSPMVLDNGREVRFYTVVPLYTEERDFEKQHGIVPLLQRLEERGHTTIWCLNRDNVALD